MRGKVLSHSYGSIEGARKVNLFLPIHLKTLFSLKEPQRKNFSKLIPASDVTKPE